MHKDIASYSKRRNPFNRQSVAFRKSFAEKIGGYSDLKMCEDYEFITRMLQHGAKGQNIPEVLVRYRIDENTVDTRKSWEHTKAFIRVRWIIHRSGYTGFRDFSCHALSNLACLYFPENSPVGYTERFSENNIFLYENMNPMPFGFIFFSSNQSKRYQF